MPTIERVTPRPGVTEVPWPDAHGNLVLASPSLSASQRNLARFATRVGTIGEAADLVDAGYALRMGAPDKRASLISPKSLRIIR